MSWGQHNHDMNTSSDVENDQQDVAMEAIDIQETNHAQNIPFTYNKEKEPWLKVKFEAAMSKYYPIHDNGNEMADYNKNDSTFQINSKSSSPHRPRSSKPSSSNENSTKIPWSSQGNQNEYHDKENMSEQIYSLVAARNEVTGLQLHLSSSHEFVLSTDEAKWLASVGHVLRSRLFIDSQALLYDLKIESFIIGHVKNEENQDILEYLQKQNFTREPSADHFVYLRIHIPITTPVGFYDIPLHLFSQKAGLFDEEKIWKGKIQLHVTNVTLPSPKDWVFHLDLWQHLSSIARYHGVNLWSDEHFHLIDIYFNSLSQLGQKAVSVVMTEMPWAGQHCYLEKDYPSALFEHSILSVRKDLNGQLSIDFHAFDRLISLAKKHHMDDEIELFGMMSIWTDVKNGFGSIVENGCDSWRIPCLNQQTLSFQYLRTMKDIDSFMRLCYQYFQQKELLDRIRICADEPHDIKRFNTQIEFLRSIGPGFRFKVAINHFDFLQYSPMEVIDFVPILPLACSDIQLTQNIKDRVHERGGRMCWYVCCSPSFPNQFVSSPLIEGQLIGWLTHFLKLDGFLRWNFCLWPSQPWNNLNWRSSTWPVGDMYFVLPGLDGTPVETLRYESLRFAIQDFELLRLVDQLLPRETAKQLKEEASKLVLWGNMQDFSLGYSSNTCSPSDLYSLNPIDYQTARNILLKGIEAHLTQDNGSQTGGGMNIEYRKLNNKQMTE